MTIPVYFLNEREAVLLDSGYAEGDRELPWMLLRADRVFSALDTAVEVDGRSFGLIPLPGHTPGHTGIVTPDNVLYVGDAVLSRRILQAAKLPSIAGRP